MERNSLMVPRVRPKVESDKKNTRLSRLRLKLVTEWTTQLVLYAEEHIMSRSIFNEDKRNLVGMIHLAALPGAPDYDGMFNSVIDQALRDAHTLVDAGFDGLMVENYNDSPFFKNALPPETIAALTRCSLELRNAFPDIPLGVNALRNDALSALSIAHITQSDFIRVNVLCGAVVTDQGLIEGCAAELARLKASLHSTVKVWADLDVKHAQPLVAFDDAQFLSDLIYRGRADCVILSGSGTGQPTCPIGQVG